jgi:hypothetical protein
MVNLPGISSWNCDYARIMMMKHGFNLPYTLYRIYAEIANRYYAYTDPNKPYPPPRYARYVVSQVMSRDYAPIERRCFFNRENDRKR